MLIKNKLAFIVAVFLFAILLIFWEFFSGGVVSHHIAADPENPEISNWWGLVTLPLLGWLVLIVAGKQDRSEMSTKNNIDLSRNHLLGGFAFGLLASLLWEFGLEAALQYVILLPLVFAFFLRIYLPETSLGIVLGMAHTFGGILPIVFAVLIQTAGFIVFQLFNRGGRWLLAKSRNHDVQSRLE